MRQAWHSRTADRRTGGSAKSTTRTAPIQCWLTRARHDPPSRMSPPDLDGYLLSGCQWSWRVRASSLSTGPYTRNMRMTRITGNYLLRCGLAYALSVVSIATVQAQMACPQGVTPGSAQCLPSGPGATPPPAGPRWRSTWGAFANDSQVAVTGSSSGQLTRWGANRAAKAKCKSMGGQECKIILAFKNQCAVVAEPIEDLPLYRLVHRPGLTVEEASSVALSECASLNQGHACKVIFSICSNPIRVN
ncbi:DUF4189 domain-containing protein [Pseudoxanthomonas japonensis]|uniref:DUF4189 domain-containing protein n=1 Tax=Pseudoxanthomonas japonensis TaxID=69284 RepID=UPI003CCD1F37